MAMAKRCDICGKYFEYDSELTNFVRLGTKNVYNEIISDTANYYDCCKECADSIVSHIAKIKLEGSDKEELKDGENNGSV